MTGPMVGSVDGVVTAVRPYAIHGDTYVELDVRTDTDHGTFKVPSHAYAAVPEVGDRVRLTFLMGQVTSVVPSPGHTGRGGPDRDWRAI